MTAIRTLFSFPATVNETAARLVAAFVACAALGVLLSGAYALLPFLAFGFLLRVLAGPKLSPLAILVVRVLVPAFGLPVRPVAGGPKRFAQGIGLAVTSVASALALVAGWTAVADALLVMMLVFASLEAGLGFCAGCWLFGVLARAGFFADPVCVDCATGAARSRASATGSR